MKADIAKIIAIVIWVLVALLLTGVLVCGVIGHNFVPGIGMFSYSFDDDGDYTVGSAEITEQVNSIDIDWISGKIAVEQYDGDQIVISEDGSYSEDETVRWRVKNGKLSIRYAKSRTHWFFYKLPDKSLTVKLPSAVAQSLNDMRVESVSAALSIDSVNTKELRIETVSGSVTFDNLTVDTLRVDTVSGSVNGNGRLNTIRCETVSGNCTFDSLVMPEKINCDSVSGDVTLTIADGDGFTVSFDKVSGDLTCDYPTAKVNGDYVYANGTARYDFETVSGDVIICKGHEE